MTNCPIHPDTELISFCPKCRGQEGGKTRKLKHSHEQLRKWGKKGGRPMTDPIYQLYKDCPPPIEKRHSVTVIAAYYDGLEGIPRKYPRHSKCWWAQKAGRDAQPHSHSVSGTSQNGVVPPSSE